MANPVKITATINGQKVETWVRTFDTFGKVANRALQDGMEAFLELVTGTVRRRTYREAGLVVRTGDLIRSIGARTAKGIWKVAIKKRGANVRVSGTIGSKLVQAAVQEQGATITAKRAPWLSFPILAPGGGLVVVGWARKKTVRIPARPYLGPAIELNKAKGAVLFRKVYNAAMAEVT